MRPSFIWRSTTARTTAVMASTPPRRSYKEPSTVPPPQLAPPRSGDVPTSHILNPHRTSSNRVIRNPASNVRSQRAFFVSLACHSGWLGGSREQKQTLVPGSATGLLEATAGWGRVAVLAAGAVLPGRWPWAENLALRRERGGRRATRALAPVAAADTS